jgi:hypothetical protein
MSGMLVLKLFVVIVVAGLLWWLNERHDPLPAPFKVIISVLIVVVLIVVLLWLVGLLAL